MFEKLNLGLFLDKNDMVSHHRTPLKVIGNKILLPFNYKIVSLFDTNKKNGSFIFYGYKLVKLDFSDYLTHHTIVKDRKEFASHKIRKSRKISGNREVYYLTDKEVIY